MEFKFIEDTLKEKYPHLDTRKNPWKELMQSSTEYGPGWHDLIIEFMQKIEELYKTNDIPMDDFKIDYIKEKYGRLRVSLSINNLPASAYGLVSEYEKRAETICDECGAPGALCSDNGGWLQTLCLLCAEELGYKPVKE